MVNLWALARRQRAGVALIVALSTPVLLGATGLCVDIGYWYQQQESLQSAADAAALAAARNNAVAPLTNALVAVAAANTATSNQFKLTALTLTLQTSTAAGATSFIATGTIPRGSFFSKTGGPLLGIGAGTQSASATAIVKTTSSASGGNCIHLTAAAAAQALYASGGARLNSAGCPIYVASTACNAANGEADAVVVDPAARITAPSVSTQGCIYANTNGGAYIGSGSSTSGNNSGAAAQIDPLAGLGTPPPWPLMPAAPTAPAGTAYNNVGSYLGYNNYSGTYGDCTYQGTYTANCELYQGALSGLNAVGLNSLLLNEGTAAGTTYISGGFNALTISALTLNGNKYDISGGMSLSSIGTASFAAGSYSITGGSTLTNGTNSFGAGTYYFQGPLNTAGAATNWGLNLNAPLLTLGAGTYYMNGGMILAGSNPAVNFGQGTYLFSANTANSAGAFDNTNANVTFTGGSYFFDGGLTVGGAGSVTFGPGIYYVRNGPLSFSQGSRVTANGATFILEGTASYQLNGGTAALNLTAPSSNCIAPANYPVAAYSLPSSSTVLPNAYAPYDGTGAEGICGLLIYQARGDSTADNITEGATSTITGVIYAPSASLSISGGATISSGVSGGTSGTLAFIQSTLSLTGGSTLNVNVASGSIVSTTASTSQILLTN